ncbi:MAG TPA: hypothetical protein VF533_24700 [Solirubrobacteraceae bacterium]|jgi:hypothetical protein
MPAVIVAGPPKNPEVELLVQRTAQIFFTAATRVVRVDLGDRNARLPKHPDSLELALQPVLTIPRAQPRAQPAQAAALVARTSVVRALQRGLVAPSRQRARLLAGIDFSSDESVFYQTTPGAVKLTDRAFDPQAAMGRVDRLSALFRWRGVVPGQGPGAAAAPPPQQPAPHTSLQLRFKTVRCVERVGFEWTDIDGKDHILCGGVGWDSTIQAPPAPGAAPDQHYRKVPQFTVDDFTFDGDRKSYNPDKVFVEWNLSAAGPWPRGFCAIPALAEKDGGEEFAELLKQIWAILSPAVIQALSSVVAGLAGGTVGAAAGATAGTAGGTAAAPGVGTALGLVVGAAVGAIIGFTIGYIADSLLDDILESGNLPTVVLLPDATGLFGNGTATSDSFTLDYVRPGQSGHYEIDCYWQLS